MEWSSKMRTSRVWRRCSFAFAGVLLCAGCVFVGQVLAQTGKVTRLAKEGRLVGKGVRIPLEYDAEGSAKSEVYAERAAPPDTNGEIRAENVRMVLMGDASEAKGTVITTDACVINPSNNTARSSSPIRIEQPGMVITGTGFRWHGAREHIRVMKDARVVTSRNLMDQGERTSAAPTVLPGFRGVGY